MTDNDQATGREVLERTLRRVARGDDGTATERMTAALGLALLLHESVPRELQNLIYHAGGKQGS